MNSIKNRIVRLELGQPSPRQQQRLLARIERGRERVKAMSGDARDWPHGDNPALTGASVAEIIAEVRARLGKAVAIAGAGG